MTAWKATLTAIAGSHLKPLSYSRSLTIQGLISHAEVIELEQTSSEEHPGEVSQSPAASWTRPESLSSRFSRAVSDHEADQAVLYERGVPSNAFTLILQGKVLIRTGLALLKLSERPTQQASDLRLARLAVAIAFSFLTLPNASCLCLQDCGLTLVRATSLHSGFQFR